jgi:hypothetical protein
VQQGMAKSTCRALNHGEVATQARRKALNAAKSGTRSRHWCNNLSPI